MIDNLNEVNRLLIAVERLSVDNRSALESSVINFCRNMVIEGQFPNHRTTIEFSIAIGVIARVGKHRLKLTSLGKELLVLNPTLGYELNECQKEFITKRCLLQSSFTSDVRSILEQFSPAYASKTYQWSPIDNKPLIGNRQIVELLRQSGLLKEKNGMLEVDQKYILDVREIMKPENIVTPGQLIEELKKANEIGIIAEKIALDFEKQRLQKMGCLIEAECIQKISDLNIAAGYDIASFDSLTPTLIHNRFIEVKGSTGKNTSFYLSSNEIRKATQLSSAYWIYFVPNINRHKKSSESGPVMVQDPIKNILACQDYEGECMQFLIRSKH